MSASATTPLADRRHSLPDVQGEVPHQALRLDRVGIAGMKLPLALEGGQTIATLDLSVDLPANQRGVHMSRFRRAIDAIAEGLDATSFARALADELLKRHPYATRTEVRLQADVSVADLVLRTEASARAGQPEQPEIPASHSSLSLRTFGSTVCPCSFAMSDQRYAHVQRAEINVEVFEPRLSVAELHALCAQAFSAPVSMLLDRPGEKALVDRMFAHPRFVEDVAREAAAALRSARAGKAARLVATAFESIHPYDCFASWSGSLEPAPGT